MTRTRKHDEKHYADRIGWLRAAVLGADGIVSTASLIVGVAAASPSQNSILLAGISGLECILLISVVEIKLREWYVF